MGKIAVIFIFIWLGFRLLLHSTVFGDEGIIYSLYFNSGGFGILGLFCMLFDFVNTKKYRFPYLTVRKFKVLILVCIIYSAWCLIVDNLIMSGVGAHDSVIYTVTSMGIISTGVLCMIFA